MRADFCLLKFINYALFGAGSRIRSVVLLLWCNGLWPTTYGGQINTKSLFLKSVVMFHINYAIKIKFMYISTKHYLFKNDVIIGNKHFSLRPLLCKSKADKKINGSA